MTTTRAVLIAATVLGATSPAAHDAHAQTDAVVIELGRQLWRDHKVTSETFAKLKAIFGPNKLVDLVLLMGNYAGTAALLAAVDMQLHEGKQPLLPIP